MEAVAAVLAALGICFAFWAFSRVSPAETAPEPSQDVATAPDAAQIPPRIGGLAPDLRPFDAIIEYEDFYGAKTRRTIAVHRLNGRRATKARGIAVDEIQAYCHLRRGYRTFKLERITALADPATGEIPQDGHCWLLEKAGLPPTPYPVAMSLTNFTVEFSPPVEVLLSTPAGTTTPERQWLAEITRVTVAAGRANHILATLRPAVEGKDNRRRERSFRRETPGPNTTLGRLTVPGASKPERYPWKWLTTLAREHHATTSAGGSTNSP